MATALVLDALKAAIYRTKKSNVKVILHSNQGSQYSSYEYKTFLKQHNI
ncbi:hypothetical protein [Sulfurimonas sp.]|jgi:putative transposase|nr:hypothetical protein [Sulfurimonas sp.]